MLHWVALLREVRRKILWAGGLKDLAAENPLETFHEKTQKAKKEKREKTR